MKQISNETRIIIIAIIAMIMAVVGGMLVVMSTSALEAVGGEILLLIGLATILVKGLISHWR